jgi:hypothetical protein
MTESPEIAFCLAKIAAEQAALAPLEKGVRIRRGRPYFGSTDVTAKHVAYHKRTILAWERRLKLAQG